MGKCVISIEIANPHHADRRGETINVLVNPKKVYTSVPRKVLEKLGLKPVGKMDFLDKSGAVISRDIGYALIRCTAVNCEERQAVVPVAILEPEDGRLATLGATGLESLGLEINAATSELRIVRQTVPLVTKRHAA